jgi:hypothetical protein
MDWPPRGQEKIGAHMARKNGKQLRLLGMELYFDDVAQASDCYRNVLGLSVAEEQPGHYTKLAFQGRFLCLERKGTENYPSQDKAVDFIEVHDLQSFIGRVGGE